MSNTLFRGRRIIVVALLLSIVFTMFPVVQAQAAEEMGFGGLAYAYEDMNIYDARTGGNIIGKIYKNESYTVICPATTYAYVDYSTSNGAKQGYIHIDPEEWGGYPTAVAIVKETSNVYYGRTDKGSSYQKAGAVYAGEYVAVIAVSDQWAYVEYDTTAGRKRGHMPFYKLNVSSCAPDAYSSIYNDYDASDRVNHGEYHAGYATVYAGPTKLYATVGSVNNETIYRYGNIIRVGPYTAYYIEYYVTGTNQLKSGFIVTG